MTDASAAAQHLRELLKSDPLNAQAYKLLATALEAEGQNVTVDSVQSIVSVGSSHLMQSARALQSGDLPLAETILRSYLRSYPADAEGLGQLAELAVRIGFNTEAIGLLRLALELAPKSSPIRLSLASVLHRANRSAEAIDLLESLLNDGGDELRVRSLLAAALARAGRFDHSIAAYQRTLERFPREARTWMHYGHLLRTMGRQAESVEALRRSVEIAPEAGVVWWSLSDMKTVRLTSLDIKLIEAALKRDDLTDNDRFHFHFALGKAHEDNSNPSAAFANYDQGNRLRRAMLPYDPEQLTDYVRGTKRLFTRAFFERRNGFGRSDPDPIFVLGMPRAGSTLVEQILASHPDVEGTRELPDVLDLAASLGNGLDYIGALSGLERNECQRLGGEYLNRTLNQRMTDRPRFVDKMPNNWMHVPLIQLMLPNAKIIDIRRHPMACCFSMFKQHFIEGQAFSNDLSDLGRYYADYVEYMQNMDVALPGRIHRVFHENLVENFEEEVRGLLDYLGLPFAESCLQYHENSRVIRSASSEQVRRPINRDGFDRWQAYEPWLGPLKDALGPVLDLYPLSPTR